MKKNIYILITIAFVSLTFLLGSWGLTESSEARYATIAKEMFESGDYINPTLMGIKHLHKPPVTYYITALGYQLFGVNEFGARFFLQVAFVFQLLLVFKITQLIYKNDKIAFLASLIYFSFPITIIAVRNLTTDAYLTTFILASVYFWLQYKTSKKPYLLYLFYLFLGLIFETKGPVGFIIPVTFVITHKLVFKEKIEINIHQFLGFLLFLVVSSAWFIAVIYSNEQLFNYFFNTQLVERVAENKFKRGKPFWYYIVLVPIVGLPWLFFLTVYFKQNLKSILKGKKYEFVLLTASAVLFLVLSISTSKLILYILPLYGFLAIFSAKYSSECTSKIIQTITNSYIALIILILGALVIASFMQLYKLTISSVFATSIFIVFVGIALFINKKMTSKNYLKPAYLGVIFIISIVFSANHIFKMNELKINTVKPIAEFIKSHSSSNNTEILVYNYLLPSLNFYLNEQVTTINHGRYTTQREVQFETNTDWKKHLINYFNETDRLRILNIDSNKPLFLIKRKNTILPDTLQILQSKLKFKEDFDKYEVFYNQ